MLSRLGVPFYYILKGGDTVVYIYVALITLKRRNINQVPTHLRPNVMEELTALGLDGYGDPIVTEE